MNARSYSWIFFLAILLLVRPRAAAQDQASDAGGSSASKKYAYAFGLFTGPFLPDHISGVTEVMPTVGMRLSSATKLGSLEAEGWASNASGSTYRSVAGNYRLDFPNDLLRVHMLLGLHIDNYVPQNRKAKESGGWQYGGGVDADVVGPLTARADFEFRFGPGDSLLVFVGLAYHFNADGTN